jgi:hypothetical protein
VNNMLNFSRLSRRTHRIVKALISCQYSCIRFAPVTSAGCWVLNIQTRYPSSFTILFW